MWTNMCIEQKVMRPSMSQGGPGRGRMKNSESGHRLWLETLNHMSTINFMMEKGEEEGDCGEKNNHKDLGSSRIKKDEEAVILVSQ